MATETKINTSSLRLVSFYVDPLNQTHLHFEVLKIEVMQGRFAITYFLEGLKDIFQTRSFYHHFFTFHP